MYVSIFTSFNLWWFQTLSFGLSVSISVGYRYLQYCSGLFLLWTVRQSYTAQALLSSLHSREWLDSRSPSLHLPSAGAPGVSHPVCLHLITVYSFPWKSEMYRGIPLHFPASLPLRRQHLDTADAWCRTLFPWRSTSRGTNPARLCRSVVLPDGRPSRAAQRHRKSSFILERELLCAALAFISVFIISQGHCLVLCFLMICHFIHGIMNCKGRKHCLRIEVKIDNADHSNKTQINRLILFIWNLLSFI